MSIFGVKKFTTDLTLRVNDLHRRFTDLNSTLQNAYTNEDITISTESKGPLIKVEVVSFGKGGREPKVDRRGHITGISLSSEGSSGEVRVGVLVDVVTLRGCEFTLLTASRKHDNFDKPFLVEAGSVINFISLGANGTVVNSVVSLLIELRIYI